MFTPSTRLVLFDIDGTLLHHGGLVYDGIKSALLETFGTAGPIDSYTMSGKTDQQILRDLALLGGISSPEVESGLPHACSAYERIISEIIGAYDVRACSGVLELLNALNVETSVIIGLLTGNLKGTVEPKLRAAGINPMLFAVGAYGSDNSDRNQLPAIAMQRAAQSDKGSIFSSQTMIIGDTPLDIACAHAAGAKVISVATGKYTVSELGQYHPDFLFENLTDIPLIMTALGLY